MNFLPGSRIIPGAQFLPGITLQVQESSTLSLGEEKGRKKGKPKSKAQVLARDRDSEGKQVPCSVPLVCLRAQPEIPRQTGALS
jgi:hypothetical protein